MSQCPRDYFGGGQGRDDEDVRDTAEGLWFLTLAGAFFGLGLILLAWLVGMNW